MKLTAGDVVVTICPDDGGRVGQITVDDRRLLRGRDECDGEWHGWGSYPLLPWSNRIPDGRFVFDGREHTVPVNFADGSAIHGLAADAPWRVRAADEASVELEIDIVEGPYAVTGRQAFRLTETHLDQELEVVNRGTDPVPVGLGIHPWFIAGPVQVPADRCWPGDGPMPTGTPVAVGRESDLRVARVAPAMDRCYTGLTDTAATVGDVRLEWSGPITQVVVFTGMTGWVCVEPVTMANDGFALAAAGVTGHGVHALAPGDSLAVGYRFDWG